MRPVETALPFVYLQSSSTRDPALELLAAELQVVTPELPEFGSPTDTAAAVLRQLDQLGVGRCTLAGLSLGAVVALQVALAEPERVDALILLSPSALEPAVEELLRTRLATVRIPTLVVCGTEDRLSPPGQGRLYRELMPNCSYVLLYNAGHELGHDRPEALAELLADFAGRQEAFVVGLPEALP